MGNIFYDLSCDCEATIGIDFKFKSNPVQVRRRDVMGLFKWIAGGLLAKGAHNKLNPPQVTVPNGIQMVEMVKVDKMLQMGRSPNG